MKLYHNSIKLFMVSIIMMANVSCNNETDPIIPEPEAPEVVAPATYVFQRSGESTVSYGGQSSRLNMSVELFDMLSDEDVAAATLLQMFNEGTGFADAAIK